jgi:hypothetical protein
MRMQDRPRDFWLSCGHHLLDRDEGGGLLLTDDFLRAYLARPELAPPPDASTAERALHAALLAEPRRPVSSAEIAAIANADARENWTVMLAFRDHLNAYRTIEAAYVALIRRAIKAPHLFINQLVHVILRNALDGCDDAYVLRAAELFFRPQRMTNHEGSLLAADEETISGTRNTPVSPLVSMLGIPASADIDVMNDENCGSYFEHSDRFDMALDLTGGRRGHTALAAVIEHWVEHLLAVEVHVEPLTAVRDASFAWYVGLDTEGTRIGNALWNGEELDEMLSSRVVGLYRLEFIRPESAADGIKGEPVYLILAMGSDKVLRLKPHNLVTGLPIKHLEVAS